MGQVGGIGEVKGPQSVSRFFLCPDLGDFFFFANLPVRQHLLLRPIMNSATALFRRFGPAVRSHARLETRRTFVQSGRALEPKKPSMQAIAELRKQMPGTSMLKAREALLASRTTPDEDSVPAALEWLEIDRKKTGAKKADKVASRSAREGVIAVSILTDGLPSSVELKAELKHEAAQAGLEVTSPAQAAIVEVNCETDFVAKNEVFTDLVKDIVHTVALFPTMASVDGTSEKGELIDIPIAALLPFPLLPSSPAAQASAIGVRTVESAIIDTVSRLGEKISIARAAAIRQAVPPFADGPRQSNTSTAKGSTILKVASAFAHGGSSGLSAKNASNPGYVLTSGRVASLLVTQLSSAALPTVLAKTGDPVQESVRALTRSLARQTAGMQTRSIKPSSSSVPAQGDVSSALYDQPFMMLLPAATPSPESSANPVQQVLTEWSESKGLGGRDTVEVLDMSRWELGETSEPAEPAGEGFAEEVRKAAGLA